LKKQYVGFNGTIGVVVWLVGAMMILSEIGVNIGPLIAAAGIAGVALGFGGQYLIRDVIAGLFIIVENQYRVGDVVCLDSTCGLVEDVNLRLTILRG
jgi:moderate conductance mechanosensitive channel